MQSGLSHQAEQYAKSNRRRGAWQNFVRTMACIVVFCTTYALILPAITLGTSPDCTMEEHSHDVNCYEKVLTETVQTLSCENTEEGHEHTEECYTTEEVDVDSTALNCGLVETEGHSHERSCYDENWQLICEEQTEAHAHTDLCYGKWTLVCTKEEHDHSTDAATILSVSSNSPVSSTARKTTITGINYYESATEQFNTAFIIDDRNNDGVEENAKEILGIPTADFLYHTAVVVEALYETAPYTQEIYNTYQDGPEYFVDAVITGVFDKGNIVPKTEKGFVLYIWNSSGQTIPQRGDYVNPNFWYGDLVYAANDPNSDGKAYYLDGFEAYEGYVAAGGFGYMVYTDNTTSSLLDVNAVEESKISGINTSVKLFNYDSSINSQGLGTVNGQAGFVFWQGDWGNGAIVESVDGYGADDVAGSALYYSPSMSDTLDADGYPLLSDGGSLAYLFDGTSTRSDGSSTLIATMTGGGGLFQTNSDGYYYFDSGANAAYYDSSVNKFVLYDGIIVRPWYDAKTGSSSDITSYGNFLPFNVVTEENIIVNAAFDNIYDYQSTPQKYTMPDTIKAQLLTGTQVDMAIDGIWAARLEDKVDMGFGMQLDFEFVMPKGGQAVNDEDMIFNFYGDDDVLIYIGVWDEEAQAYDYKLAVDLSGVHAARAGTINFATGVVTDHPQGTFRSRTMGDIFREWDEEKQAWVYPSYLTDSTATFDDYTKLSVKFFYLERGGNIAYCRMRFNLPTLPDKSLTVSKELDTGDADKETAEYLLDTLKYQFRVAQVDAEGNLTGNSYFSHRQEDGSFLSEAVTYTIMEDGIAVGTGTVDETGSFWLKAGQSAQFDNMMEWYGNNTYSYVVQEVVANEVTGQYKTFTYQTGSTPGTVTTDTTSTELTAYTTKTLSPAHMQYVIYRSELDTTKTSTLKITKELAEGATLDEAAEYRIQVKIEGALLAEGTEYTVGEETRTVGDDGAVVLKVGETATIQQMITAGMTYEVTELGEGNSFHATYTGEVDEGGTITCDGDGAEGTFPLDGAVHVTVTNSNYAFTVKLPISKQAVGNTVPTQFNFLVEQVEQDENGAWIATETSRPGSAIVVADDTVSSGSMYIGFAPGDEGDFYFRVYEQAGTGDYLYDDTYYIVKITASNGAASVTGLWKNGTEEMEVSETLSFVNYKTTSITVTETVIGGGEGTFSFEVTVTLNGETITTTSFELAHEGSIEIGNIPYGATVTVTQTQHDGFTSLCTVLGTTSSETATVDGVTEPVQFDFVNESGYALPSTGGAGTFLYTFGGVLLTAAPLVYGYTEKRKRERRNT